MNINPQPTALNLATVVNPSTDSLRRENVSREIITQPTPTNPSAAEKGVASERERARTPSQNGDQIDFAAIQEQAEKESSTINDADHQHQGQQSDSSSDTQDDENGGNERNASDNNDNEQSDAEAFQEQQVIRELSNRDREVRTHERAHDAVGGPYTGSPSYTFEEGPDGQKYAIAGEVSVDLSTIPGNNRATIAKMQKVKAAALAPANPSAQDTKIAAEAQREIVKAQSALAEEVRAQFNSNADEPELQREAVGQPSQSFREQDLSSDQPSGFDSFVNQTINAQERIAPSREDKYNQRAQVISSLYSTITQAYERPPRNQFELTA